MFSTWIGVVLLFAFFGLLTLVVIGASPRGDTYEERRAKTRVEKLKAARDEMSKTLTSYAWANKDKGIVRIPIDDAMKLTVAELAQKKPMPANPIAPPAANPSPQNAAQTSGSPGPPPKTAGSEAPKSGAATPSSETHSAPAPNKQESPALQSQPPGSPQPAASPSTSAPATPLPIRGKTP